MVERSGKDGVGMVGHAEDLFADQPMPMPMPPRRRKASGLKGRRDLTMDDRIKIWNAEVLGGLSERQISRDLGITRSAVRAVLADGGP